MGGTILEPEMSDKRELIDQLRIQPGGDEAQPRSRAWRWIGLGVAALTLAAAATWRLWGADRPPRVQVVTPVAVEVGGEAPRAEVLDASGYVVARQQATVSAEVTGKLTEVRVEEGMQVDTGQVLARLDAGTERAQLELARAQRNAARSALQEIRVELENARRTQRRERALRRRELSSQAALDDAATAVQRLEARLASSRDELEVAERNLALAQQRLDELTIRAPFTGIVIAKAAQPGEMVSPISAGGGFTRTGICTIVDMDSLEIELDVNEAYIKRVSERQRAIAVLDAYPDWEIPAEVIAIVPTADRQKATVRVRVGLLEEDARILPEMGVKVRFLGMAKAAEQAGKQPRRLPAVPASALQRTGSEAHVYLVRAGRVERRAVRVGNVDGGRVTVSSGLAMHEKLVADPGGLDLADGDRVRVRQGESQ